MGIRIGKYQFEFRECQIDYPKRMLSKDLSNTRHSLKRETTGTAGTSLKNEEYVNAKQLE